jgi:hypothetical protein
LALGSPDNFPMGLHPSCPELDIIPGLGNLDTDEASARAGDNNQGCRKMSCTSFEHDDERRLGPRDRPPSSHLG